MAKKKQPKKRDAPIDELYIHGAVESWGKSPAQLLAAFFQILNMN